MHRNLKLALLPVSWLYGAAVLLRNALFDHGIFNQKRLPVPVISVGNMTTGGTGKTPVVEYIAGWCRDFGMRPAVLSRGYKRRSKGYLLVSDGSRILADSWSAGDEPVQLARRLSGVPVAVDEVRRRGGKNLVSDLDIDVLILDDGFQHRWVFRDLDIILTDGSSSDYAGFLIPAGMKREPLSSMRRAHLHIITKFRSKEEFDRISMELKHRGSPQIVGAQFEPVEYTELFDGEVIPLENLRARKAYLFSGIAVPENFHRSALQCGLLVVGSRSFLDHHRFSRADITGVEQRALRQKAEFILTTEKDAARIGNDKDLFSGELPVYILRLCVRFTGGGETVVDDLLQRTITTSNHTRTT